MYRRMLPLICAMAMAAACAAAPSQKLRIITSAAETRGTQGSSWTYAWFLDGRWSVPGQRVALDLTLDSDYARGDKDDQDRLRTSWRIIGAKDDAPWQPVLLVQTEGDHLGQDSLRVLAAGGYRLRYRQGFIEVTAGASKDTVTADAWTGDIGLEFAFEQELGERWKLRMGPKAALGAFGDARVRDDRVRYSVDATLDYKVTEVVGIGYRVWLGNTSPRADRTQWVGLTFSIK